MNDESIKRLSHKKRQLSKFLCQEMLYDYVTEQLDDERRQAVSEFINQSPEMKEELESLKKGISYCEEVSQTQLSEPLVQKIFETRNIWSRAREILAWSNWPEFTKWGLEAFAISAVVALIAALSWPKLAQLLPERPSDIVLAEVDKQAVDEREVEKQLAQLDSKKDALEVKKGEVKQDDQVLAVDANTPSQSSKMNNESADMSRKNSSTSDSEDESQGESVAFGSDESEETETSTEVATTEEVKEVKKKPSLKGFVYRAFMTLGDIEIVTEQIRAEIQSLGGEKAGEVRLGWRKPKGSYFHFSLPEQNYDRVVERLRSFGPVRIYKDPHWRVMPEDQIRFILWVEDASLKK